MNRIRRRIKVTSNFKAIEQAYYSGKDGICLEGGSRSGKTVAVVQFLALLMKRETGNVFTVGRDFFKVLKDTLMMDVKEFFPLLGLPTYIKEDKYFEYNGNLIRFVGLKDDPLKVHGMAQDIFWVNEGINISKDTIDNLQQRTEKFFIIDYNPSEEHHFLYDFEKLPNVAFHKTTVLDNPFAPEMAKRKILSYEPTPENYELGTADPYKWKVYGLGLRSADEAVIFKDWKEFRNKPSEWDWKIIGGDFGYTEDPAAAVEIIKTGNSLYVTELLYEPWLINNQIAEKLAHIDRNIYQVWDSSEPKSIQELRIAGLNAIPAVKGPDSVHHGIQKLKTYKLFVNEKSLNLQTELRGYKWSRDKSGKLIKDSKGRNIPIDRNNHLIDALRYGVTKFANA